MVGGGGGGGGGGEGAGSMTSFVSAPAHSMCDTGKEVMMFEMELTTQTN